MIVFMIQIPVLVNDLQKSLGYPTQTIKEKLEEPCTHYWNAGAGKVPWSTKRFITSWADKGFINNGDSVKHVGPSVGRPWIIENYGLQHTAILTKVVSYDVKTVQAFLAGMLVSSFLQMEDSYTQVQENWELLGLWFRLYPNACGACTERAPTLQIRQKEILPNKKKQIRISPSGCNIQ